MKKRYKRRNLEDFKTINFSALIKKFKTRGKNKKFKAGSKYISLLI